MANIKISPDNLWVEYYQDDMEEDGFYIDSVYIGSDPQRTNIYEWLHTSGIEFIKDKIRDDMELRRAWA